MADLGDCGAFLPASLPGYSLIGTIAPWPDISTVAGGTVAGGGGGTPTARGVYLLSNGRKVAKTTAPADGKKVALNQP